MKPTIVFLSLVPEAPEPTLADATLRGTVPLRAYQHCIPFTQASAFGWHIYPPIDFSLLWDGAAFVWKPEGTRQWLPLGTAQMPGYSAWFAAHAPERYRRIEPPFLSAFPEQGVVQVWSGYAARMRRGWSLLVRAPVNEVRSTAYDCLEGIVEQDWWCGPILSNLRFKQSGQEVQFRRRKALFQVQPVPRFAYAAETLRNFEIKKRFAEFDDAEWSMMDEALFPGGVPKQRPGTYARRIRKRA